MVIFSPRSRISLSRGRLTGLRWGRGEAVGSVPYGVAMGSVVVGVLMRGSRVFQGWVRMRDYRPSRYACGP